MRVILQRILDSELKIDNQLVAATGRGLLLLIGVTHEDTEEEIKYLTEKCLNLRIFEDSSGKMNLSVKDIGGEILAVSQFTLYGNTTRGRRPGFDEAAKPAVAEPLYKKFVEKLRESQLRVKTGEFGKDMKVNFTNDGPVTFILEK